MNDEWERNDDIRREGETFQCKTVFDAPAPFGDKELDHARLHQIH
jgi:hypothetical protein